MKRDHEITGRHRQKEGQPGSDDRPSGLQAKWDEHWFFPETEDSLFITCKMVYAVVALWFITQLSGLSFWWDDSGLAATKFASSLEGYSEGAFPVRFRVSPLWVTQSKIIVAAWCVAGAVLASLCALKRGARTLRIATALWTMALVQRMSWSAGIAEPYLVALTAYLAIARMSHSQNWTNCFARKLIQMHTWLLLCAALASQLALAGWRQGEAAWWLAASGRSNILSTNFLEDRLLIVNVITHGLTLSTILAIGCLWPLAAQPSLLRTSIGVAAGLALALGYAVIGDQFFYGALLTAGVLTSMHNAQYVRLLFLPLVTRRRS